MRRAPIAVTIYSRPGCHLCDDMKALVEKVARTIPLTLEDIDIFGDDDLEAEYGLEIPVLCVEGKRIANGRISEATLARILTSAASEF
jgi:glutaredoxin